VAPEIDVAVGDEVDERLAADEDDVLGCDRARLVIGRGDAASIRAASVATAPTGYVSRA
jgi:hypothetical protein